MKLIHEYNEYVVGLVVTDEETGRSVNFQYDPFQPSNHPEPKYYLKHSCEGDDTADVFNHEELEIISAYVNSLENSETLENEITKIMYSDLADELKTLHAEQGCIYHSDIVDLHKKLSSIYAISVNGSLTEYNYFNTEAEAQAELDTLADEDAYLCKIIPMSLDQFNTYCLIEENASNNEKRIEILKAFDDPMFSDSQDFVIKNLSKLGLTNDLNKAYFKFLIKAVYSISDEITFNSSDEPDPTFLEPQSYEDFATQYIENLIFDTFEKKVNLAELIK